MMNAGGMHLYKWCSNSCHLLSKVSTDDREYVEGNDDHTSVKALGLSWNPKKDCIVGPIIVTAKVFMQKLWLIGLSWDEVVPDKEKSEFENFIRNLQNIEHLNIPRCIIQKNNTLVEIHGFSDSSEQAYGAYVYVRCKDCFRNFSVNLLCNKLREAPVKCVTLPRLELLGAVLLSKLVNKVLEAMQIEIQITDLTNTFEWHHINSKDNPADPLSRGLPVDDLNGNNIWWCSPDILHRDVDFLNNWDCLNTDPAYMKELKPIMRTLLSNQQ
ncbi:uncharacterized protein TNCV_3595731 [Trichonephila clavipes]|nr:uncharacterized protein TNCV_3595731 [Trichonephila clavipes]